MIVKYRKYFFISLILFSLSMPRLSGAALGGVSGRILLQVESHGEAWYVEPLAFRRYYLGRPADAFLLMQRLSLGISNADFDLWQGYAPARLAGRFLIKPQDFGRAYYVYPPTLKLHYLGRPADAFLLMRQFGLGIKNTDLAKIAIAPSSAIAPNATTASSATGDVEPTFSLDNLERSIFDLVNGSRQENGLSPVNWSDQIAAVAREHSQNLATENFTLIDDNKICSYPFIHHEGTVFGLYHSDRLNNRQIYNFSSSAENIALIPLTKSTTYYSDKYEAPVDCQSKLDQLNHAYEDTVQSLTSEAEKIQAVKAETVKRAQLLAGEKTITISSITWYNSQDLVKNTVDGWMNSPGHRANILNGNYTDSGMGVARIKDYIIVTQVFVKAATCGYRTGPCCEKAGYLPYCYIPLNCDNFTCR